MKTLLTLVSIVCLAANGYAQDWAKARLEKSPRHIEWVKVKNGSREIKSSIAFPEVKDKATAGAEASSRVVTEASQAPDREAPSSRNDRTTSEPPVDIPRGVQASHPRDSAAIRWRAGGRGALPGTGDPVRGPAAAWRP